MDKCPIILANLFLLLLYIEGHTQRKSFNSDNGFSGTFELHKDNLKEGSITIDEFKTSVGTFSDDSALSEFNVVFPYDCADCTFEIVETCNPYKVTNTQGRGFANVVVGAKKYIRQQEENTALNALILHIRSENNLFDQRRLAYAAYQRFTTKERIDELVKRVEAGDFLENGLLKNTTVIKDTVVDLNGELYLNSEIQQTPNEKRLAMQTPETKVQKNVENPSYIESEPLLKYRNDKCVERISKLEKRLSEAKQLDDNLIINEVQRALKKQFKKCKL